MITLNILENLQEFAVLNYDGKSIKTKSPWEIFSKEKKVPSPFMEIKCQCSDPDCKNSISIYYGGLSYYCGSKNLGSDTEISIDPSDETEGRANNTTWNPTEKNVSELAEFLKNMREAIEFKKELLRELYVLMQVHTNLYGTIEIVARKEEESIRFFLFEIPTIFSKVPLLSVSKNYRECLGVISNLPLETDLSEIKNDYAKLSNPFFMPIIKWIDLLGKENNLENISVKSIWVMPE